MPPPLLLGETVLFSATYNLNELSAVSLGTDNSVYGFVNMPLIGRRRLVTSMYNMSSYGTTNIPPTPPALEQFYLAEQYMATTATSNGLPRGQISWAATYPHSASVNTDASVIEFMVTGKSGIYSAVNRVVIDFTDSNIRRVFFIV